MATPAAVLSVLLEADTTAATAKLTKYDKQLAAVNEVSKKGIETRLTGNYNPEAFTKYEQALSRAARVAKDRAAFKAELGANFNNRAFNQYQRALDKAETGSKVATTENGRLSGSFGKLAKSVAAAGGAFVAFEAAKEAIDTTVELGHTVERLSAVTGLDTKQASLWIESLKSRGLQSKQVSQAFITLSRNIRNAGEGSKTAKTAFDQLGVSQDYLRTHSTEDVLLQAANGLKAIHDPAQRAAIAQQLFGRGSQALIPVLADGKKGVDDMLASAEKYGAFLPNSTKATAGAVEAQRNLSLANDGLKISFTEAVLPTLVKASQGVLNFIAQMRSGQGAGGQFADAISRAFGIVKNVVTGIVGAVGGLGNAVGLMVAAFVASKIIAFGSALKDLWALMADNPITAVISVVGFLATAFSLLSGHQESAAQTARDVANAWDAVRSSANALRDANLAVVQANIDIARTSQGVTSAEQAKKQAFDQFGAKSPQYKQATLDLKQAELDHTQAVNRLSDSMHTATTAQTDATTKVHAAIDASRNQVSQDQDRIRSLNIQIAALGHQGGQLGQIHDKETQLSAATQQLTKDQAALNDKLNSMPSARLTTIDLNVDFQSNMAGAIAAIAKSIGGSPLSKTPAFAAPGHFTGGMVTQPGYFAGEEAPRHPEVILATNPAYRSRNLGLFAQAGAMLGVPGFAAGGITPSTGNMVSGAEPWAAKAAGAWMKPVAGSWVNKIADQLKKSLFSGGSGSASVDANLWIQAGGPAAVAQIAGAISMAESGGRDIVQQGQPYSTTGWGRWQITPGNSEPQFGVDQALLIPINNARAAIAKYTSAPHGGNNFTPWTTYTSGAYKQFLGAAGSPGITLPTGGGSSGGLGTFQGYPVDSWIIPELQYAQAHGWTGHITSGYRTPAHSAALGFPNDEHTKVLYPGGAVDFGGMIDPAAAANRAAFIAATKGYAGPRLLLPQGFHDDGHMSGTGGRRGGIFDGVGHFAKGGIHGHVSGFAKGGHAHSASRGGHSRIPRIRIPRFAKGGTFKQTGAAIGGGSLGAAFSPVATPTLPPIPVSAIGGTIGLPPLPKVGGSIPTTISGAQSLAGTITGLRTRISSLSTNYGNLDTYFNIAPPDLVDSNGNVVQSAVNQRLAQLARLVAIRQQIFELWGRVVIYTQRLVAANRAIIAGLESKLGGITTTGLKGKALTAAKALQTSTRSSISKYQGNLSAALGDLGSASGSRVSSWLDVLDTRNQSATVSGTTGTSSGVAGAIAAVPVDSSGQLALLQTLLTQSQQTAAVANAQFGVLQSWQSNMPPFGGSFATGGVVPGPAGSPRTIVAHGGETVGNGMPVNVTVHVLDGAVDKNKIMVTVDQRTRQQARLASRRLPGSR